LGVSSNNPGLFHGRKSGIHNLDAFFNLDEAEEHIAQRRRNPAIPPGIVETGKTLP
jgi:hypothetical protein